MRTVSFQQAGAFQWPAMSLPILLILLALSAIILWRRYRSRRQLHERISELEALSSAGRAIVAAQLDLEALCRLVAGEAAAIIDTRTFQIGLLRNNTFEVLYWTINNQVQSTPKTFNLKGQKDLVGWVRDNRKALLVTDFKREMADLPAEPSYIGEYAPRSAVYVPVISGQHAIGMLAAESDFPGAFSKQDLGRLEILSNQAAAAIVNAQIYEQERTRSAQLELVGQIARQVNAISDLDDLLGEVVELTKQTFGFGSVNIFEFEEATHSAVIQASTIPGLSAGALRLEAGVGLVGTAIDSRTTALSNDTLEERRFFNNALSSDTRSEISIPLIVNERILGALDVQSPVIGAFTPQERQVLEALADQVAIAIHKAQQLVLQRKQSWFATAQLQIAEAIGRTSDVESLAATLVRLTAMLTGAEHCLFLLWDKDIEAYRVLADFGLGIQEAYGLDPIYIGQWGTLDAVHVGMEAIRSEKRPPWVDVSDFAGQYLLLPLVTKGRAVAVMQLSGSDTGDEWPTADQEELSRSIANQAALAIDSIELQNAQQEEAWVNTALLQVAEAVNKLTDLNEILYTIVRMVPMLVGVKSCIVLIWDEEQQSYQAGPSHGLSEMGEGLLGSFEVDLSEFPLLERQDVERLGPDAAYYTFKLPGWMGTIMGSTTADVLPLYARARLVGALVVGPSANDRSLSGRRLNIVTGIAQQAAIAVVNDRLYKESAERNRMEQELQVARSIQASLIPARAPEITSCDVAGYWQAAREVSGDFFDFMRLENDRWGIAIADVADKGVPAALFMALSRTILRTVAFNRQNPAQVLQRTNQLIYNDSTSDLFVTVFYAVWNAEEGLLSYASGGHNPPMLVRRNGQVSMLEADGIALGVLESVSLEQRETVLRKGDVVVLYTDGVTEAINEDYDEFGLERLRIVAGDARGGTASDIVSAITTAVGDHAGETPQYDDITLVVLKY